MSLVGLKIKWSVIVLLTTDVEMEPMATFCDLRLHILLTHSFWFVLKCEAFLNIYILLHILFSAIFVQRADNAYPSD